MGPAGDDPADHSLWGLQTGSLRIICNSVASFSCSVYLVMLCYFICCMLDCETHPPFMPFFIVHSSPLAHLLLCFKLKTLSSQFSLSIFPLLLLQVRFYIYFLSLPVYTQNLVFHYPLCKNNPPLWSRGRLPWEPFSTSLPDLLLIAHPVILDSRFPGQESALQTQTPAEPRFCLPAPS